MTKQLTKKEKAQIDEISRGIVKGFTGIDIKEIERKVREERRKEREYKKLIEDLKPMIQKLNDLKILARLLRKKNLSGEERKNMRRISKRAGFDIPF